jgi:hypothetical protein
MKMILIKSTLFFIAYAVLIFPAFAAVSFVSASNSSVSLYSTVPNDDGSNVFVMQGLADGETSDFSFTTDTTCPLIAMTGGAKFSAQWSCADGVITASVIYKGGMSFGPGTEESNESFYITFSNPPTPPGFDAAPTQLAGIQISLYGGISQWNLDGEPTATGVTFGIELGGTQGSDAHFLMDLPETAVGFLGGVIGVSVGGKPDPFASVVTNDDASVSIKVDIDNLQSSSIRSIEKVIKSNAVITKKILAGERSLSIASSKSSVKSGATLTFAMCSGKTFTAGNKVPLTFLLGNKSNRAFKATSLTLNANGCGTKKIKVAKSISGNLVAKVVYKGTKATAKVKITK